MWAAHFPSGACSRPRQRAAELALPRRETVNAAQRPETPPQVSTAEAHHARLAAAAPVTVALPSGLRLARALECGWHPTLPPLWPHLLAAGADTTLSCDVPESHLEAAQAAARRQEQAASSSGNSRSCVCGNTRGCARFLAADVGKVPSYQGPFSVAHLVFPSSLSASHGLAETLAKAVLLVAPGGHLVLGSPTGRAAADAAAQLNGGGGVKMDVWCLPSTPTGLAALLAPLPLTLVSLTDEPDFYAAVMQVRACMRSVTLQKIIPMDSRPRALFSFPSCQIPPLYALPHGPLRLQAPVVRGFGRGSASMGIPTANMEPEKCMAQAAEQAPTGTSDTLRRGVYYGWARVVGDVHGGVVKAVVNVGKRPTFADGSGDTVEVHLMHTYSAQFYGAQLKVVLLGFIRPEMTFEGVPALIARIRTDIGSAASLLDVAANKEAAGDAWLLGGSE